MLMIAVDYACVGGLGCPFRVRCRSAEASSPTTTSRRFYHPHAVPKQFDKAVMSSSDLKASTLFSFSNHVVLVSGGATGLGEMAAEAFVQNGARVIIASRKESALQKVRQTS